MGTNQMILDAGFAAASFVAPSAARVQLRAAASSAADRGYAVGRSGALRASVTVKPWHATLDLAPPGSELV